MWIYLGIIFAILLIYIISDKIKSKSLILLAVVLLSLSLFVGLGDMLGGYDRYIYGFYFDRCSDYIQEGKHIFNPDIMALGYQTEPGYMLWNCLIALITRNRYIFILITTLCIYLLLFVSIKDYTKNYPFALIAFMALWFFFSFTYLRQVLAATIGFYALRYILKRKFRNFLFLVLVAASIHNSALILLPFYFLPIKKFSKSNILKCMGLCLLIGISNVSAGVFAAYSDVSNDEARMAIYDQEGSFRIAYFVEASFFLYFILRSYSKINENDKQKLMLNNMALCFCAILLFFIRSEIGGRLAWYYMIGIIATLSFIVSKRGKISFESSTLIIVFIGLYIRILLQWGTMLYPYKTFLTPGTRPGDSMVITMEYDHNYDSNKFYR